MAKSRNFSIYLLKPEYNVTNSFKNEHALGEPVIGASALPKDATLFVMDKTPTPPWWRSYWGIQQDLKQTLKGAIAFLPVGERCFAITFGHTYRYLKETSYEYDFGLRVTLNALDPSKLKSVDILQPENARRTRVQSPTASDLTFFDFHRDESIIKKLTGAVKKEYKDIFINVTGASSLRVSSKVPAKEISQLCEQLLRIYIKVDYKQSFPDIQNIIPIKDPSLLDCLHNELINAFKSDDVDLILTIPEIIDYDDSFQIQYSGAGKSNAIYDDVDIAHYREYLEEKNIGDITLHNLKSHRLNIQDENGNIKQNFSVYKCILFDCTFNEQNYHFCEGEWYKIEKNYIQKLRATLDPHFIDYALLSECNEKREDTFNVSIAARNPNVFCLDKKNIASKGQTQVEPCDIYYVHDNIAQLIHIKISTRSSSLSHLFNQGLISVELLKLHDDSKEKLKALVPVSLHAPIDENKYAVIYGIITGKDKSKNSDSLPLFSRISLLKALNALKLMGVSTGVVLIKDNVDRKRSHADDEM